jgi:hypothetical protein
VPESQNDPNSGFDDWEESKPGKKDNSKPEAP